MDEPGLFPLMTPRRFYVHPDSIQGDRLTFGADEARHIARVLRLRPGALVIVVDGTGREYTAELDRVSPRGVVAVIRARHEPVVEPPLAITLAQGVAKGDRMELIIRAATELGVAQVVPLITRRTVVRLVTGGSSRRVIRWQRVATEAAKQCGRAVIPTVEPPLAIADYVGRDSDKRLRICLWERAEQSVWSLLDQQGAAPTRLTLLIGPEGGFENEEVAMALAHGVIVGRLGPRLLRTETAGLAALAILQHRFGDLGG